MLVLTAGRPVLAAPHPCPLPPNRGRETSATDTSVWVSLPFIRGRGQGWGSARAGFSANTEMPHA
jgi:hypothetical protein